MSPVADPGEVAHPEPSFDEFQRQTSLMTSCTLLWKELSDHFTSLEQDLERKSAAIKDKFKSLDSETKLYLEELDERESTLESSISALLGKVESSKKLAMENHRDDGDGEVDDSEGEAMRLRSFCVRMDFKSFWGFVVVRKKELESLRQEIPKALGECVDPPKFVLEAISEVFPVNQGNRNGTMSGYGFDMGWACVLLLESLIPVMVDPVLGKKRMLVTPKIRKEAEEIAEIWKRSLEERGGIENVKTPDVHTFLQHLVTFGIVKREDLELYRKLVVASAWRKQMPKLAVSLGLGHKMPDMIEELISRGQQVDAVHFSFEVGLVGKYPPVPLLKAFLKDAKKMASSIMEDPNNSGRATHLAGKKEQSALRAVIRCIEEYKLEAEFPPETLKKRLEQLERTKAEKRKPVSVPANKRTRANNGGPMPPAKAGRLTNAYVSSFPPPPAFVRSPSYSSPTYSSPSYSSPSYSSPSYSSPSYSSPTYTQYPAGMPTYPSPPAAMYGSRSPQYAYSPEAAYPPVGYPTYGGYGPGMAPATPAYHQQAYY